MHPKKQWHTWQCQQLIDTTPRGPSSVVTAAKSNGTRRHGHGDPVPLKMGPIGCPERQKGITTLCSVISQKRYLIYIAGEARNHARLHIFCDKQLETSYLLHHMPGIPISILFQRVAAYKMTEVICDFPLPLLKQTTPIAIYHSLPAFRYYVTYILEKALFNKLKRFRKSWRILKDKKRQLTDSVYKTWGI
jgi:hypothetical protein